MAATSRELVYQTLNFENPARPPRNIWLLPIARMEAPDAVAAIQRDFPGDMIALHGHEQEKPPTKGKPHYVGEYIDEWGCVFTNIHKGVIGEVKQPLVNDWADDVDKVHIPVELLTIDKDSVNRACAESDKFCSAGPNINVFERIQWIRGPEMFYMDLVDPPAEMLDFLRNKLHKFNCDLAKTWCETDIDKITIFDDWGSQRALLINPAMWREFFKPLYAEYAQIAHSAGKKIFMHSDGYIVDIYPDLIEIGIDALNSQIACMGVDKLAPFAGQITFWGEVDRQYLLSRGTVEETKAAVRNIHTHLWRNGGCIAQCEFGAAARPENVRAVFETWDELFAEPSA